MARNVPAIDILVSDLIGFMNNDLYLGALTTASITGDVCFDCALWNNGYVNNSTTPPTTVIKPIKTTLLTILAETATFLTDELANITVTDYGFKTQLERLLTLVQDLQNKVNSIQCNNTCSDVGITAQLLSSIVMTVLQLVTILETINGLLSYMGTCGCIGNVLFDILMGKFINSITDLQCLMQDWYGIVMTFFQYSAMPAKSYVASYMPRQQIIPPPAPGPISHACVPCPPRPQCQQGYQQGCQPYGC